MKEITANVLCDTTDMPKDEWLQWRKKGIGGSDIAVAAGVSPWKGPWELWLEKMGHQTPEFSDESMERMEAGTRLEPVIRDWFADKHPEYEIQEHKCIYQHPLIPWALVNVDGIIVEKATGRKGLLECKNVGEYAYSKGDWSPTEVPFYYMTQEQWGFNVTGLDWGFFAYLVGGNNFQEQFVKRDDELIGDLTKTGAKFMEYVNNNVEPPQDHLSEDALNQRYRMNKGDVIDLSLYKDDVLDLKTAKETLKAAEKDFDLKKNVLKRIMENAEIAFLNDKKIITWKDQDTTRIDVKRLRLEVPELALKYSNTTTSRVFRPNYKGIY